MWRTKIVIAKQFDWSYRVFLFFQAAESGNLEIFQRLYFTEPTRLSIKDSRGRTVAHQAAFGNRVDILQFIQSQRGGELKTITICYFKYSTLDLLWVFSFSFRFE